MIGTIVNTACIVAGSVIGSVARRAIKEKYQMALYNAMGLAAFVLGINAVVNNLPKSDYPVLFIVSLALGSLFVSARNQGCKDLGQFRGLAELLHQGFQIQGGGRRLL